MPILDETPADFVHAFIFGMDKCRKTTWACQAADAGYNVLLLDGAIGNRDILFQEGIISPEGRKRIYVLDVNDRDEPVFCNFFTAFVTRAVKKQKFYYNEEKGTTALSAVAGMTEFDFSVLDSNWVVVFDHYTAFVKSAIAKYAKENDVDIANAKQDWDGYRWCGNYASHFLEKFRHLPCHTVTIGHVTHYERYKRARGVQSRDKEKQKELLDTFVVPISTSGPHSMTVTEGFSDVLFFEKGINNSVTLDYMGNPTQSGGGRRVPPKKYLWPPNKSCELPLATLLQAGHAAPPEDTPTVGEIFHVVEAASPQASQAASVSQETPMSPQQPAPATTVVPKTTGLKLSIGKKS